MATNSERSRFPIRRALGAMFLLTLLAVAGCGGPVARPTGKVLANGLPLPGAEVTFTAESDTKRPFFAKVGKDGGYFVDYAKKRGVPAGKCKVTVTWHTLLNGKPLPEGEAGEALRHDEEKTRRNVVVFDKELKPGENALDLDVTQGKPASQ